RARGVLRARAYAAYAWALYGAFAPFVWLGILTLPRRARWALMRGAARLAARLAGIPLRVEGLERLPGDRPFVLAANHSSYLDVYALVGALPVELGFVAKAELARNPFIRIPLRRVGVEFVQRADRRQSAADARRVARAAGAGRALAFFPEGTFTRMPGLLPFRMGAFVTAAEAGLPVVPVAIRGTRSMLRSGSWLPRRGAIRITVGAPIEPGGGADRWSVALGLRDATRAWLLEHCGEPDLAHERPPI
nr:1-acyl-sn-glycerol-3-phosphate acyltransferase [Gammaproteobacteria bacterium]